MCPNHGISKGIKKRNNLCIILLTGGRKWRKEWNLYSSEIGPRIPAGSSRFETSETLWKDEFRWIHSNEASKSTHLGKIWKSFGPQVPVMLIQRARRKDRNQPKSTDADSTGTHGSAQPWTTNPCFALFNNVRTSSHLTETGGEIL